MPVTAKLSLRFYEKLGEEVANELVDWFNSVDATYRADLRELNELNFARFDAKLEQRVSIFEATVEQRFASLEAKFEHRISGLEAKFEQRFAAVDARFESLEARLIGRFEKRLGEVRSDLQRWMIGGWSSLMVVMLASLFAVLGTR